MHLAGKSGSAPGLPEPLPPEAGYAYGTGNLESLRRTVTRAADDLLQTEQLFQRSLPAQPSGPLPVHSPEVLNVAFRASLKHKMKLNEADVRKEFTYEYVSGAELLPLAHPEALAGSRKSLWPTPSLMREKSSAIQDLRARSESPSANKVLGEPLPLKDPLQPEVRLAEAQVAKIRPPPPPKPSGLIPSRASATSATSIASGASGTSGTSGGSGDGAPQAPVRSLPVAEAPDVSLYENVEGGRPVSPAESLPESLPESLAGFAATIISDGTEEGSGSPVGPTVSPLISECDWMTNNTNASGSPLPDLMSLTSTLPESEPLPTTENLYVNTLPLLPVASVGTAPAPGSSSFLSGPEVAEDGAEDHYLPMTSAKLSFGAHPLLLPLRSELEENAYVEMGDGENRKQQVTPLRHTSVFAGVLDQSYRSPESPRYSEISDCRTLIHHPPEAGSRKPGSSPALLPEEEPEEEEEEEEEEDS